MPLTDDYTFVLGDAGVVLNTSADTLPFVDIEKVDGLDNAPFRTTERDHEGVDGGFIDAEFEKGRPVVLEGQLYTNSLNMESFLDTLKSNWAPSKVLIPFYFKAPGIDERVLFVKPLGCRYDWSAQRRLGIADIQFSMFAEDPRIYTASPLSFDIEQASIAFTGRSYNKEYDYGYGAPVGVDDQVNLPNPGSRPTGAIFTIYGPVQNPQIINETVGKTLQFNIILGASDTLVVDILNHTVTLNGTANRRGVLNYPDWFLLEQGDNFIRFRADSAGPSTMNVTYRAAWR